ncbi:MAG TPA: ribonuclease H-like domain-containing protein [Thermoanaerobaculia bacterium]|nr:ribonuclease H-like domain-containing protein [Thermoanaerobaculia bacterium]
MKTVVFDIETVSLPWLEIDVQLRGRLTRWAEDHEDFLRRKEGGALSPYMGKVIVIGMMNPETGHGIVWHEAAGARTSETAADGLFEVVGCDEKTMLGEFWEKVAKYGRCVTFNGRCFDGPFLSVRSAVHGISPSKNLLGYRYSMDSHVDLLEILSFQGAVSRDQVPSLHAACIAFGIPSPKSEEIHGYAVGDLYRQGRVREIADYCRRDVEATAALYRRLEPTLLPLFRK